jgi:hypothetical protein
MAGPRAIPKNATTDTGDVELMHVESRVARNPYTKDLVPEVKAFRAKLDAARTEERGLLVADAEANAAVQFADQDLDESVEFVGDNTDRKTLLGGRLFGDLRVSELKKPVLGGELEVVSAWPDILAKSEKAVLEDHVPLLTQRVAAAVAASAEKKDTSNKLADFRAVGTRVKLNEEHNAFRKSLYGKLGEIQHANSLPSGWAESFFLQESSESLTVTELNRKVASTEAELEALKKQRDALKAQEEKIAAARADAVRKEKKAKLEALAKARAELEAKESALRAELGEEEGAQPSFGGR